MVRPMTSIVAALSSVVAKGHQTIHIVSSAPSKIPYGGFSPVRLQTRFLQRPPSRALSRTLIGRHCRYLRSRLLSRSGTCVQAAPKTSDHDHESSGPWLHQRLFCPPASSLTMATSELLIATPGLFAYPSGSVDNQKVPNLLCQSLIPCRRLYSDGSRTRPNEFSRLTWPSSILSELGNHDSTHRTTCGSVNEAATFTLCCGLESCLPRFRTGRLRPSLRRVDRSAPTSVITT
jgi:hypothetical protein